MIWTFHCIEVRGGTSRYLESLCDKYALTEADLIWKGLELTELHLAELEARKTAIQRDEQ